MVIGIMQCILKGTTVDTVYSLMHDASILPFFSVTQLAVSRRIPNIIAHLGVTPLISGKHPEIVPAVTDTQLHSPTLPCAAAFLLQSVIENSLQQLE